MKTAGRESAKTILIAGLPESGKTTFLAAFYHAVEGDVSGKRLRLVHLPRVRSYLEAIRYSWLSLEAQSRTLVPTVDDNRMTLSRPTNDHPFELLFPDLKGEIYQQMLEKRTWSGEFEDLITRVSSLALFINPDLVRPTPTIQEVNELAKEIVDEEPPETSSTPEPWDYARASTDVHLVDLLQLLLGGRTWRRMDRLAVIVSAWDLVRTTGLSPADWIRERLPLLSQFLTSISPSVSTNLFGVSAQGGDFEHDKEHLASIHKPEERVAVVDSTGQQVESGITAPILWMLG